MHARHSDQSITRRAPGRADASSSLELFYDLIFAFTITQVSHLLIGNLGWQGAVQAAIVLLGAWWSWNYTTWFTDELDGDATPVRLLMFGLMTLSLLMAISIPDAFGHRGLLFAGTYVAIQLARHGFLTFVAAGPGTPERARALQIVIWFLAAGVFWIGGALAEGWPRMAIWGLALVIDYAGPRMLYRLPGHRLGGQAWEVNPAHFSDRFACFVILTLGEAIAITGATMTDDALTVSRVVAFIISFFGSAAFWWLYFSSAWVGSSLLDRIGAETEMARDVFTYGHLPLVAGILLTAVGDEFVLAHPLDALSTQTMLPVALGPILFLLGTVFVSWRLGQTVAPVRIIAALAIGGIGVAAIWFALPASITSGAILVVLAAVVASGIQGRQVTPILNGGRP